MRNVLHWLFRFAPRAVTPLLLLVPLVVLLVQGTNAFLRRTDAYLAQINPLITAELSHYLKRTVTIGKLSPTLTTVKVFDMVMHPETIGTLPIDVFDITVKNRPDEFFLAGTSTLATTRQLTVYVSLPEALGNNFSEAITRIQVVSPELSLVRDKQGIFNLQNLLPPPKKQVKGEKPFRTVVEVTDARVHFRDYAAFGGERGGVINDIWSRRTTLDLSEARTIELFSEAQAFPGSLTATHLGGAVRLTGTIRRDYPDAPQTGIPFVTMQIGVKDGDFAYWLTYILHKLPVVTLRQARGDADIALVLPDRFPGREEPLSLNVQAVFKKASASLSFLPLSFEDAEGTLELADGVLRLGAVQAHLFGEKVSADGTVWNLPQIGVPQAKDAPFPAFHVVVNAPRVPVADITHAFFPNKDSWPKELTVEGKASAQATISGSVTGSLKDVSIVGRVRGGKGNWQGLPGIENALADVDFHGGVLRISNVVAALVGGGRLYGKGDVRLVGAKEEFGDTTFSTQIKEVDLSRLSFLSSLNTGNPATHIHGIGTVEAIGQRLAGKLTAEANISAQNLAVGKVPIPTANARVTVKDKQAFITGARFESPSGIVRISGATSTQGDLNLRFAVTSLDLQSVGHALNFDGIGGTISAMGTLRGTMKRPLALVEDMFAFNLSARVPVDKKTVRQLAVDLISAQHIEISPQRLRLLRPLSAYRFPARSEITGEITNLLPKGAKQTFDPHFHLIANVTNLSYEEIQRQIALIEIKKNGRIIPAAKMGPPDPTNPPLFSSSVATATVHLDGKLTDPHILGKAALRTTLIGPYPLIKGSFTFDYDKRRTLVQNAELQGDIGTVQASASLTAKGLLSGSFAAPDLDIEKLSYLTKGLLRFQGAVGISGHLSGNLDKPVVTADISSPQIIVAGTTYTGVLGQGIQFIGGDKGRGGTVQLPLLTLVHNDTQISLTKGLYNLGTGDIGAELTVKNGDIVTVLEAVRHSGLEDTPDGAGLARALASLPNPTDAQFDVNKLAVRGQIVKGVFENPQVDLDVSAHQVVFGEFTDPTKPTDLVLKGTLRNKVINVTQFQVTRSGATIRGEGVYDPDGQVDAYIESNDASLDIIHSVRKDFPLRGSVDFSISAKGSSKNPRVTASLLGRDLFYVLSSTPGFITRKQMNGTEAEYGVGLSLVRVEADLTQVNPGQYAISISDSLVRAANVELTADAVIPVTTSAEQQSVAQRPLRFNLRTNTIDLKQLVDYLQGKDIVPVPPPSATVTSSVTSPKPTKNTKSKSPVPESDVGGTLSANIAYGGSLDSPSLSGTVTVTDAHFRLPRNGNSDRLSPVTNFNANLRLAGSSVLFDEFLMKLGGVNGQKGDFGTLAVSGGIKLQSLSDLERILRHQTTQRSSSLGIYDLSLVFKGFRPALNNLFGLGEEAKGRLDGAVRMTGDLLKPIIATATNAPMKVTQVEIHTPTVQKDPNIGQGNPAFNPEFKLEIALPDTAIITNTHSDIASLTNLATFRFDVQGFSNATITGHVFPVVNDSVRSTNRNVKQAEGISDLECLAELTPRGGYFRLPTAYFKVQRGGKLTLRYGKTNPGVYASGVVAKANVPAPPRSSTLGNNAGQDVLTSNTDTATSTTRYDITMTLDGSLLSLDEGLDRTNVGDVQAKKPWSFVSEPQLQESDIENILFGKAYLDMARSGQTGGALRNFASGALASVYIPGFVSQLTGGFGQKLGLEDLTLDFTVDGRPEVRGKLRFKPPYNRYVIEYARTVQQRDAPNELTPFKFSFSYELYQFKSSYKILPRIQLGFKTDEQHNDTYFLRGVVTY